MTRTANTALHLFVKFWLMALPLVADNVVPFHGSVVSVSQAQDATHPEHAYVSRVNLTDSEKAESVPFEIPLKMRNLADLQARLSRGETVSQADLAANYEPSAEEYQQVVAWLTTHGFTVTSQDPHHLAVFVTGRVDRIGQAMNVTFAKVHASGKDYTSAVSDPQLPASLSGIVLGVNGLQPHLSPHHHAIPAPTAASVGANGSANASSVGGPANYTPQQIASAYDATPLYNQGITGAGQTIAIMIDTFPAQSDLTTFWSGCGINQTLSNMTFINVSNNTLPATSGEETLDTEWASSMAPGAKVRIYACGSLSFFALDQGYAKLLQDVQQHPEYNIHQLTMSYGLGEQYAGQSQIISDDQYFAELAAAGVTCFAASGDGGSTPAEGSNDNAGTIVQVSTPASDPNVTAVGGTSLNAPNGVESDEEVWNGYFNLYGTGGGVSTVFGRPTWQTGPGTGTANSRHVPDIASGADPYHAGKICWGGVWGGEGGTSWASPTTAGLMALINQVRANAGLSPVGLLGPKIYPLIGTNCFRDITVGNNITPTSGTDYYAGAGYDCCTGIGSMQVANLSAKLTVAPAIAVSPTGSLTLPSFQSGSAASTTTFTISNPGQAALTVSGITYSGGFFSGNWTSGTIAAGASQTVTVTSTASAAGSYTGTISIANSASSTATTLPVSLTVTAAPIPHIAVNPSGTLTLPSEQLTMAVPTTTFTISNPGTLPLVVSGITYPANFSGNWTSGTIASGTSQTVTVTSTASAIGTYTGTIVIANNAGTVSLPVAATLTPAPVPQLAISPSGSLTLPSFQATTGVATTATFTISNPGEVPLVISGITYPAKFAGNWTSGTIASGTSQTITVSTTASAAGTYTGNISIASNATGSVSSLALSVTVSPAPPPQIAVTPSGAITLPGYQIGSTATTATFTISNPSQVPLVVSGVTYPVKFSGNWTSGTIAAGGSQAVTITSTATATGTYTGSVAIANNATASAMAVPVSVIVAPLPPPQIVVAPTGTLVLPGFQATTPATTATFTISNPSQTPLVVSGITYPVKFSGSWTSGTIAAGGSQAVTVTSTATATGTYTGSIAIANNATTSAVSVPVSVVVGNAPTAQVALSPTGTITLPASQLEVTSSTGSFTLTSTGQAPLVVSKITFPSGFAGSWTSGTITPGSSQVVNVSTTATSAGTYRGSVTIASNATNTVSLTLAVTLAAAPPAPTIATVSANGISASAAVMNGTVKANGNPTAVYFQYGPTTAYGSSTMPQSMGSGTTTLSFTVPFTGLPGATLYHYRAVASNGYTTVYGSDMSFTTLAAPTLGATLAIRDAAGVILSGAVSGNGVATTVYIQYGTTASFGSQTPNITLSGSSASAALSGLKAGTTYYYRIVTVSAAGTYYGSTGSFTTSTTQLSTLYSYGSSAPGVSGAQFSIFGYPAMNSYDNVAFRAVMSPGWGGVTATTDSGIWADDSTGTLHLVARQGSNAPGTTTSVKVTTTIGRASITTTQQVTATFAANFSDPVYNNEGQVAFTGTLNASTAVAAGTGTGIWSDASGTLSLVARIGEAAPGVSGDFTGFTSVALPDQGGVLLLGTAGTGRNAITGLWEGTTASNLLLLAYTGEVVDGTTVTGLSTLPAGEVQTRSFTQSSANMACAVTFSNGTTAVLKLVGDDWTFATQSATVAPGANNVKFSSFSTPVINANNHTAYAATLANSTTGIWADGVNGTPGLLAVAGGAAPGTSSTFASFSDPVDNSSDVVAFRASLATRVMGIWSGTAGNLQLVALAGNQAPDCAPGVTYSAFTALGLPDQGGTVFTATLAGTGVTSANNSAIFAGDSQGNINLIMRTGDSYNGKIVSSLSCLPTETAVVSGQTRSFAQDVGDLSFGVSFTDGTTALVKVVFP